MTDHIIVARYQKGSEKFEIVIAPDKALAFRQGKGSLKDAVRFPAVYSDAKKGQKASAGALQRVFGTDDPDAVAEQILTKGDVPMTKSQRQAQLTQLRARIVQLIHQSGVDPKTHAPHPLTRIENALDEAKVRIDANQSAEAQLQAVVKQLTPILPIKKEVHEYKVQVPAANAGSALHILKGTGKVLREEWSGTGDLHCIVEVPGGLSTDFQDELMKATHGKAIFTVMKRD